MPSAVHGHVSDERWCQRRHHQVLQRSGPCPAFKADNGLLDTMIGKHCKMNETKRVAKINIAKINYNAEHTGPTWRAVPSDLASRSLSRAPPIRQYSALQAWLLEKMFRLNTIRPARETPYHMRITNAAGSTYSQLYVVRCLSCRFQILPFPFFFRRHQPSTRLLLDQSEGLTGLHHIGGRCTPYFHSIFLPSHFPPGCC